MSARYGVDFVRRDGTRLPVIGQDDHPLSFATRERAEETRRLCLEFQCLRTRGANCRHEVVERQEAVA